jgi:protease-4
MDYFKNLFYRPMVTTTLDGTNVPTITTIKPLIANIVINNDIHYSQIMTELQNAANNPQVHGVLLLIDNNGGSVGHFSVLHDIVKKVATYKPVVGLITGYAFSGGYLIASACDYLICPSCTEIGSIGTIWEITKYKDAKMTGNLEAQLDVEIIHAGEYKALSSPYKILSENQRVYMKAHTEKLYKQFVKAVAQNRKLDINNFQEWADAKIFISPEALELGLIDEIGTIFEAEDKLRELISSRNPDCVFEKEITYLSKPATTAAPAQ